MKIEDSNDMSTVSLGNDHLNERAIFDYLLRSDDSYDQNSVYWADLSFGDWIKFVIAYDTMEAMARRGAQRLRSAS